MLKIIDTHTHLEEIQNLDLAVQGAGAAGVIAVIGVGSELESNKKILEIAEKYKNFIFPCLGYHPSKLNKAEILPNLKFIEENISRAVGVGEIGLDYKKDIEKNADKKFQKSILEKILLIANTSQKPVVIHSRYAWEDAFNLVESSNIKKAVFHWYSGPFSVLEKIVKKNYFISVTPALEYNSTLQEIVKKIPLENLLLETDSPVPYGIGEKFSSRPKDVLKTLKAVSRLKNIPQERAAETTTANAINFFSLPL